MEARTMAPLLLLYFFVANITMTEGVYTGGRGETPNTPTSPSPNTPGVYIVFTLKSGTSFYLRVLSSVLGSKNAVEDALIYSYNEIHGFSAFLTRDQAALMSKQPEVLYVIQSKKSELMHPIPNITKSEVEK